MTEGYRIRIDREGGSTKFFVPMDNLPTRLPALPLFESADQAKEGWEKFKARYTPPEGYHWTATLERVTLSIEDVEPVE